MIGPQPRFFRSIYFEEQPVFHLSERAPEDLKEEFEDYMNYDVNLEEYKEKYPKMKHPYYTWEGKIVDRG